MQSEFSVFFDLGLKHIADPRAYDHIVFLVALCAVYSLRQWRQVAILVTAFTIGHSVSLALAVTNWVSPNPELIEMLIPITICLTALYNVATADKKVQIDGIFAKNIRLNYLFALVFGIIHGLGFSNYLKELMVGNESGLLSALFAFNVGLEAGQLLIVAAILALSVVVLQVGRVAQRSWTIFISGSAFGIAVSLIINLIFG